MVPTPTNTPGTLVPRALFDASSVDSSSPLFFVWPNTVALLQAFDFPGWVPPDSTAGTPGYEPQACVNMVIMRSFDMPQYSPECFEYIVQPYVVDEVLAEDVVMVDGCPWSLSACQNIGLIDIPGMYRLVLNDDTLAGNVQVYLTLQRQSLMQRPSRLFLGG